MKRVIFFIIILLQIKIAQASFSYPKLYPEKNITTVEDVSRMNFNEFHKLTHFKGSITNRVAFLMLKKELKKQVKLGNGAKDITPVLSSMMNQERFRFKIGGFLAGLVFGIFGVGATYLITKDRNVHRSAWIGFGILVLVALISIISIYPVG